MPNPHNQDQDQDTQDLALELFLERLHRSLDTLDRGELCQVIRLLTRSYRTQRGLVVQLLRERQGGAARPGPH
jgi:hypothetical protein